jgi:excisionase family DNA binding protein
MTAPLLYTVAEAAELLNVTQNWLEESVSAQTIPHRRLGRKIRFSQADLDSLIEQSARRPVSSPRLRSTA